MDVYCKSHGQSYDSWQTYVALIKQVDLKAGTFPKHTRTTFKRGVTQFCKQDKAKLAKKWLSFEESFGTAATILECHKTLRKVLPGHSQQIIEERASEQVKQVDTIEESKDNDASVASGKSVQNPKHTLFLKNLSLAVEEEDISALFASKLPDV